MILQPHTRCVVISTAASGVISPLNVISQNARGVLASGAAQPSTLLRIAFMKRTMPFARQIDGQVFSVMLPLRLDSEGPVSFIKQKYVNPNAIREIDESEYECCDYSGKNYSKLKIFGFVNVKAPIVRVIRDINLFVFDDNTMKLPITLGSDSFKKFGFKFVPRLTGRFLCKANKT